MACAIEDAGFEIRDSIHWIYGSGFPKGQNISKAIDKQMGVKRKIVGKSARHVSGKANQRTSGLIGSTTFAETIGMGQFITESATDDAKQWEGWNTSLKPAHEPIVLARKPLAEKTIAANVLKYGTGAMNIDGCRIASSAPVQSNSNTDNNTAGRWPPNVLLTHSTRCNSQCVDGCPVGELDRQSGNSKSIKNVRKKAGTSVGNGVTMSNFELATYNVGGFKDEGGASRFFPVFKWQAKAPTKERPKVDSKSWPTVKPLELMRWLVRLVTPPDGIVLEPFAGSGTTLEACYLEGFKCMGIDCDELAIRLTIERMKKHN
jgi:site-specific DNA-methyltransferase (adenine-specific)